jgi:predicted nucleic acid-binding protein
VISAVDTSVLLDVLCDSPVHADRSAELLRRCMGEGLLIACECVIAEIRPALGDNDLTLFLEEWGLVFTASTLASARLAGAHFAACRERGGAKGRVIPDFLIGAHAQLHADRLLARDRGYLRDYFKNLNVLEP